MSGGTWVKARGLQGRNPFTQRVAQQAAYVNNNNMYLLQLGCHPVAVVILHVYKT